MTLEALRAMLGVRETWALGLPVVVGMIWLARKLGEMDDR